MAERTAEDIKLYARYPFLLYVDFYAAQIISQKPTKDQDGNDAWEFVLHPTDELIKRYDLKANKSGEMLYTQTLPFDLVINVNADPAYPRWFYLRTYDGQETHASGQLKGNTQQKIIMELKRQKKLEEWKVEVANEKARMIETNISKYLKRNINPILQEWAPIIKEMINKEKKE